VRALALRAGGSQLVSAGGDGRLVAWDVAGGAGVARTVTSMKVGRGGWRLKGGFAVFCSSTRLAVWKALRCSFHQRGLPPLRTLALLTDK
jgi:hypothetical protein